MIKHDSNLTNRLDGFSSHRSDERTFRCGYFIFTAVFFIAGLTAVMLPLWIVYRSIDPQEQRELILQSEIIYISTRKILFWLIFSLTSPVIVGVLYLISRGRLNRLGPCGHRENRFDLWNRHPFWRAIAAIPVGGIVVWLILHLDMQWADQQIPGGVGLIDLGTMFLGSMIGPLAMVAVLFLTVILCMIWLCGSPKDMNITAAEGKNE